MNSVKNARIALFFSSINLAEKLELANALRKSIKELDGDPLIMPIPDDAPAEIPRIVLTSKNKEYSLNLSPQRLDFFFNNQLQATGQYNDFVTNMIKHIEIIDEKLRNDFSAKINRMGLIVDFTLDKKDAIEYLKGFFEKSFSFKENTIEGQVHFLNRENQAGFEINNWIRIISQTKDEKRPSILISNDLNSIVRKGDPISKSDVEKFFKTMFDYVPENVKNYV